MCFGWGKHKTPNASVGNRTRVKSVEDSHSTTELRTRAEEGIRTLATFVSSS